EMMHISVGDDDATTLLQEKRGRWWWPLYAHELKGLKSKMAFGQIQSINGVDYLLRDWISNSFCELWTVTVAVTVNVTMRHCLCSMSQFKFFRGAIPQCNSGVGYQARRRLLLEAPWPRAA
ncbi:hypothetical protein FocTR4_00003870, partial [Fusarium oxysporum f. sp. cubense]